jgi:hypothetical protein
MPGTPVPSGSSSALKLLVLSFISSYIFGLAYEHAAAYYVELSQTNSLLVWDKFPMTLVSLVPSVVWTLCRAIAFVALGMYVAFSLVLGSIAASYDQLMDGNRFDLDKYFAAATGKLPSTKDKAKVAFLHRMNVGGAPISINPIALAEELSPFVNGLRVTSRKVDATHNDSAAPFAPPASGAIVVGTIRMGFGHHRIAYAASSWAVASGKTTYFHDLLNIDSAEARLIKDMDKLYSAGSRLATEMGGVVERLWGNMSAKQGDENSLRIFYAMAEQIKPLLLAVPRDTPIITSHCLVGLLAVACGFKRVVNLVIDNHAQYFIVVPGALNLVQGPTNYHRLLRMGVPPEQLKLAGAWIPKDLVDHIEADCRARIARAAARKPVRLLIPVGGAGAQRTFVSNFVRATGPLLSEGKLQLFLNAGDHTHMKSAFVASLAAIGVTSYTTVDTLQKVLDFCADRRAGKEPSQPVTLFAFADYFPAVATTDLVGRVTDVLCAKPSELAFYPIPKLNIRRVGDHEAFSAIRASELGDGTLEARELDDAMAYLGLFVGGPQLLTQMNESIMINGKAGLYNGCKVAVECALGK